jgi:hypothetical protein
MRIRIARGWPDGGCASSLFFAVRTRGGSLAAQHTAANPHSDPERKIMHTIDLADPFGPDTVQVDIPDPPIVISGG